jgi:hypothetical protein
MQRFYSSNDIRALGFKYSRQHLDRLEAEGRISPAIQRAPGCRKHYTEQHIRELSGQAQPSKASDERAPAR